MRSRGATCEPVGERGDEFELPEVVASSGEGNGRLPRGERGDADRSCVSEGAELLLVMLLVAFALANLLKASIEFPGVVGFSDCVFCKTCEDDFSSGASRRDFSSMHENKNLSSKVTAYLGFVQTNLKLASIAAHGAFSSLDFPQK